jgi:dihydrofolate reductase
MTTVTMVVAASTNNVIGRRGKLPWRLPDDLRRFRLLTMGKPVVMGRKTYDSIGRPLTGRRNIVVSTNRTLTIDGCDVVSSPDEALDLAAENGASEVMIIGGERIYMDLLPRTVRIHMTRVHCLAEGDAFFPALKPDEWHRTWFEPHPATADQPLAFTFETLERPQALNSTL